MKAYILPELHALGEVLEAQAAERDVVVADDALLEHLRLLLVRQVVPQVLLADDYKTQIRAEFVNEPVILRQLPDICFSP